MVEYGFKFLIVDAGFIEHFVKNKMHSKVRL